MTGGGETGGGGGRGDRVEGRAAGEGDLGGSHLKSMGREHK